MQYAAKFEPDDGGIIVTFPDIPEVVTSGKDEAEARSNARDGLEIALLTYVGDDRRLPVPTSPHGEGYRSISLSAVTTAKLAFIEAFKASGMTGVALAGKLGKAEGEVRRMLDPYHATKLGALEAGLKVLGKRLVVTVEEAA